MSERIHITSSIIYSNAAPHVGHALEVIATDAFARWQRRKLGAANVTYVTGTDEHGDKNRRAALAVGLAPKQFADQISAEFRKAWAGLNIKYDSFVRTTDDEHQRFVQRMLTRTYESGDIYFKNYEGLYCVGCERFYTEKELLEGSVCPVHSRPVELISEGNYFLRLDKYRDRIRQHIERNPDFIRPDRYRNEALNMLTDSLDDLCITRPKSRLDWGIELPFDSKYVTWVWYDAFWAYMSHQASQDPAFSEKAWPTTQHFLGKDILKTHAIYWPAMLMAAGLPLFHRLNVHGWVNYGGARMSKSSGNVADPVSYERAFGPDVLRYFLLREAVYGLDVDFSEERIIERYNADLANDLGNLTSRVLSMAARYFNGKVQAAPAIGGGALDRSLAEVFIALPARVGEMVEALAFNRALEAIWQALDASNKYVVATSPFSLVNEQQRLPVVMRTAAKLDRVAQILANLLEGLRVVAGVLEPFMPVTSGRMLEMLAVAPEAAALPFGDFKAGYQVKPPVALFPRIEKPKV
jgi:methionyl-tRNA synthetase